MIWVGARAKAGKKTQRLLAWEKNSTQQTGKLISRLVREKKLVVNGPYRKMLRILCPFSCI